MPAWLSECILPQTTMMAFKPTKSWDNIKTWKFHWSSWWIDFSFKSLKEVLEVEQLHFISNFIPKPTNYDFWSKSICLKMCEKFQPVWSAVLAFSCNSHHHNPQNRMEWLWLIYRTNYRKVQNLQEEFSSILFLKVRH